METIKNLREYLESGHRLLYTDYTSLNRFILEAKQNLPERYSLFSWSPYKLDCKSYFRQGGNGMEMLARFNSRDENQGDLTLTEVLKRIQESCEAIAYNNSVNGRSRASRWNPDVHFPPKSLILLIRPMAYLGDMEAQTLLQMIASFPIYANSGYHILIYEDYPITDRFITQHGVELKTQSYSEAELRDYLVKRSQDSFITKHPDCFLFNPEITGGLIPALKGLTPETVDQVLDWGILNHMNTTELKVIKDRADEVQARTIRQSEMLSFLPVDQQIDPKYLGGFSNFLEYMQEASVAFSPEARDAKLDPPRGVVLLGIPGTGKSMAAKALSSVLGLRTLVLNMSSAFGSLVGESESRIRHALKQVEDFGHCILLIDEADKAFAGATGATGDSGTTKRVLGTLLTWLQEKKSEIFVVLTMNSVTDIPPEFLRAGRFDRIFYTSLPTTQEREDIIRAQFARRGITNFELKSSEWQNLSEATANFTGAELEEAVKESMRMAFIRRKVTRPTFDELYNKAASRVPMYEFEKEKIEAFMRYIRERATPVSKAELGSTNLY